MERMNENCQSTVGDTHPVAGHRRSGRDRDCFVRRRFHGNCDIPARHVSDDLIVT